MRSISLTVLLVLATAWPITAFSDDPCRNAYRLAKGVMEIRQEGIVPAVDMVEIAEKQEEIASSARDIVLAAYSQPRYSTVEYQEKAVSDFANDVYIECQRQSG